MWPASGRFRSGTVLTNTRASTQRFAKRIYVPNLAPDFAYMHWRSDYELADFLPAYEVAERETQGFTEVGPESLQAVIFGEPSTLRVFRVLIEPPRNMLARRRSRFI